MKLECSHGILQKHKKQWNTVFGNKMGVIIMVNEISQLMKHKYHGSLVYGN